MDKIKFTFTDSGDVVDFFVLEQTRINGIDYILVTDQEDGDAEAFILKDLSGMEDQEAIYEIVEDEKELEAVAAIFNEILEDISFESI
ncbi:DUF1292 domain-containing protein [Anaerosacchariphilus polymeriproducens]|uniref:DUF1292 domain-containing protein n=1 Tax=Anaerosacchariphilus polymeriproducens TaxID=1812858 RepID=A0A371ASC6_9FIRM|nr:DUF1292 domain-containing protein [Anaerosacchariphilus polymeriproducens]RDU22452.1 DUF1292 domain-containing protein [Anaerosacchariphilus polymeriproducens]